MPKEIHLICRYGNKETDIKFFKHLFPPNVQTIVEPFAGSFAVSKYMYDDNKKYHINDLDEDLFYIYQNHQNYKNFLLQIKEDAKNYDLRRNGKKEGAKFLQDIKLKNYDEKLLKHFIKHCVTSYSVWVTKSTNYNKNENQILNNATITNKDYMEILNQYKDDDKAFLFLDPPYLLSNNSSYVPQSENQDSTKILIDILEYMKTCKCKVMLVINKLYIITLLFKDYFKLDYTRKYQISKKSCIHSVYCNY